MLRFKNKEGKEVMKETDDGRTKVQDKKLAKEFHENKSSQNKQWEDESDQSKTQEDNDDKTE